MKLTMLVITTVAVIVLGLQIGSAQTTPEIKVRGCLQGNGSEASPWVLRGAVLPNPPAPPAAAGGGRGAVAPGAGGGGGGAGARGDGGGRGDGAGAAGQPPAGGGRGAAGGGGRGGDAGRGAAPAPAPAPPAQPPVDLRLTGVDMTPWRNMFVEIDGTLGARPATGLREFQVSQARSAYGDCR